jgi:Flp pilus assembly protein TadB
MMSAPAMNDDDQDDGDSYDAQPHALSAGRRIARNSIAVFLVAFFVVTLVTPYGIGAAVSVAIAALYALVQCLAARPGGTRRISRAKDTVH